jgi:hypothetical protein
MGHPALEENPAYWTQVEVEAGVIFAVHAGFNPGELLDFLLGWFGADIYGDDCGSADQREARARLRQQREQKKADEKLKAELLTWRERERRAEKAKPVQKPPESQPRPPDQGVSP